MALTMIALCQTNLGELLLSDATLVHVSNAIQHLHEHQVNLEEKRKLDLHQCLQLAMPPSSPFQHTSSKSSDVSVIPASSFHMGWAK